MSESDISDRLLEYLRSKNDNQSIQYETYPIRLTGGEITENHLFQLKQTTKTTSKPLVLRLYPNHSSKNSAIMDGTVQNYLAENGYPAPHVPFICSDPRPIGKQFIVMEFIPGETLRKTGKNIMETLVEAQIKLHQLDPYPLKQQLTTQGVKETEYTGLRERGEYIRSKNIDWLNPALRWIDKNKPPSNDVICHCDIHSNNILMDNGRISGVIDWSEFTVDDPWRDFGSTFILFSVMGPKVFPSRKDHFAQLSENYLNLIREYMDFNERKFGYYQAVRCLWVMVGFLYGVNVVRESGMLGDVITRFSEITGITPRPPQNP